MDYFSSIDIFQVGVDLRFIMTYRQGWPDLCSIQYLCRGSMEYACNGGEVQRLSAPVLYWVDPRCRYHLGPTEAGDDLRHYTLFRGPRAREMMENGFARLSDTGYVPVAAPDTFDYLWRELRALHEAETPSTRDEAVIVLERMLLLLSGEQKTAVREMEPAIADAMRRLRCEPFARFDLQALAREYHMSYSQFRKKFRRYANTSPHDYALRCRMEAAGQLLLQPGVRVAEVAAEAGYDDPAQFSRDFSTRMGLSPRQYRDVPR